MTKAQIKQKLFEIVEENIDIANYIDEGLSDLTGNFKDISDTKTYMAHGTTLIWAAVEFIMACYSFDPNEWELDD